jgi:hypothetical protein
VLHVLRVLASIQPGDRLASQGVLGVHPASRLSFAYRWFAGENRQHNIKCVEEQLTTVFDALQHRMQLRNKQQLSAAAAPVSNKLTCQDIEFLKNMHKYLSDAQQGLNRLGDTYEHTRGGAADVRALAARMQTVVCELDVLLKSKVTNPENSTDTKTALAPTAPATSVPTLQAGCSKNSHQAAAVAAKLQAAKAPAHTAAVHNTAAKENSKAASWASVVGHANKHAQTAAKEAAKGTDAFDDGLSDDSLFDSDDDDFLACEPCEHMKR